MVSSFSNCESQCNSKLFACFFLNLFVIQLNAEVPVNLQNAESTFNKASMRLSSAHLFTCTRCRRPRQSLSMAWSWPDPKHQSSPLSLRRSPHRSRMLSHQCRVSKQMSIVKHMTSVMQKCENLQSCILCWSHHLKTWQCCRSPSWYSLLGSNSYHAPCTSAGSPWSELRIAYINQQRQQGRVSINYDDDDAKLESIRIECVWLSTYFFHCYK